MLIPREKAPELKIDTLESGLWDLHQQSPKNFTFLIFYRGYHCPLCHKELKALDKKLEEFEARGVNVLALSCDSKERAEAIKKENDLKNITIGYGLGIKSLVEWALYVSSGRGKTSAGVEEPDYFCEPAHILVRPNGNLYSIHLQSTPFARPDLDEVLDTLDFIEDKGYPERGIIKKEALLIDSI